MHPKRKTIGVRVPAHAVAQALLAELNEPMLSATLILPGDASPPSELSDVRARLERDLDLMLDSGPCGIQPTTVIDLSADEPVVLRKGRGQLGSIGVSE
jgi:tRNA A37 threonylcarbamoyladenosine synthetase subunit TsaC/SUA5/YrdC